MNYENFARELASGCQAAEANQPTIIAAIEAGFLAATKYRQQLPPAPQGPAQIAYFKHIWPAVQSTIRFYELAYYLERFWPRGNTHEQRRFWLREMGRRTRYMDTYADLYAYLQTPGSDGDQELFGGKQATAAIHSSRVAELIALDRYAHYLATHVARFCTGREA
jgi:hypothetical protein